MRIFVGPHEVAGYYANLTKGLRSLGSDCDFVCFVPHPFGYEGETRAPLIIRVGRWFNQFRGKKNRLFIIRLLHALLGELLTSIWGFYAIFRYDTFIFGFGKSLLPWNIDLPILKIFRKTVVVNLAHGAEARPPVIGGGFLKPDGTNRSSNDLRILTRRNRRLVSFFLRYASVVVGAPFSTSQFSEVRFINSFAIGNPFDGTVTAYEFSDTERTDSLPHSCCVKLVHSPSYPAMKGTSVIIRAIENLKQRGHDISLVLIHGKPNSEVLYELERCDFVVDQLYSDTPMAGFATEAAWHGKPAVVGGYGLEKLRGYVPEGMWPPSKTCNPDQVEQAIEEMILDVAQRHRLGQEAQRFVREKWSAEEVAKRYLRLIKGDIPDEWWVDPLSIIYVEGTKHEALSKESIRDVVNHFGVEALQLSHRPDLEAAFLKFAEIDTGPDIKNASSIH
jgi:glycosyltransferase involved in cell wall biosynthesis